MSIEDHKIHEENVGAYLLSALSEVEERGFERHVAECHVCRDELDRLRPAVDALPRSVMPLRPPVSLKASLMREVQADVRRREGRDPAGVLDRLRERIPAAGSALTGMRPAVAVAAVGAVLLVGVLAGYGATQFSGGGTRTVAAQFDADRVAGGSGSLLIPADSDSGATLRVHGLPTLPSNETYQVWLQHDGEVVPKALFNVGEDGNGLTAVDGDLNNADAVLVTREPAGGARSPSGKPIVRVAL